LTHTVGLLWTSDQTVAEGSTYTRQDNIEPQETSIHARAGFEHATSVTKRQQTDDLDRTATEVGTIHNITHIILAQEMLLLSELFFQEERMGVDIKTSYCYINEFFYRKEEKVWL
jgi:hypothetical protein